MHVDCLSAKNQTGSEEAVAECQLVGSTMVSYLPVRLFPVPYYADVRMQVSRVERYIVEWARLPAYTTPKVTGD